jgi:hypothetical protein
VGYLSILASSNLTSSSFLSHSGKDLVALRSVYTTHEFLSAVLRVDDTRSTTGLCGR